MLDLDSKKLAKIPGIYKYFNPHQCKINLALEYSTNETNTDSIFCTISSEVLFNHELVKKTIHNIKTTTSFGTVTGQGMCPVYFQTDLFYLIKK